MNRQSGTFSPPAHGPCRRPQAWAWSSRALERAPAEGTDCHRTTSRSQVELFLGRLRRSAKGSCRSRGGKLQAQRGRTDRWARTRGRLAPTGRDGSAGVLVKALSQQVSGLLRDEMQPGCPGHLASLLVHPSPAAEPGLWAVSWCRPAVLGQLRQSHRPRGWRPGQGRSAAALQGRPACRRPARRERCRGPGRRGAALRKLPQADRVRAR